MGFDAPVERAGTDPAVLRSVRFTTRTVAAAVLIVVVAGVIFAYAEHAAPASGSRFEFTVPAGSAAAAAEGRPVDVLPSELTLRVGDHLVIWNDDSQNQIVGPFTVRAGEVLDYRFPHAGTFKGQCTLHPSGNITIVVV